MSARVESVTVLRVEDDGADARLLRAWLSESVEPRFRACHVTRLADANSRAEAIAYDAVVLDLALPDSSGLGTVASFRAANPDTALVVVTGSDDARLAAGTVQLGAHEFASKHTLGARALATAITRAIARHQLAADCERLLAQIRDRTSKLRSILHAHPDGVVLHDSAARVLYANAAAELLLSCRCGQPLPTPLVRPGPHWRGAMRVECGSGEPLDVEVDATPVRWKDDGVAGVLFFRTIEGPRDPAVRMGRTGRATLMASLDAMTWRIDHLRAHAGGGSLVRRAGLGDASMLLSDLRRLIEDARHLADAPPDRRDE